MRQLRGRNKQCNSHRAHAWGCQPSRLGCHSHGSVWQKFDADDACAVGLLQLFRLALEHSICFLMDLPGLRPTPPVRALVVGWGSCLADVTDLTNLQLAISTAVAAAGGAPSHVLLQSVSNMLLGWRPGCFALTLVVLSAAPRSRIYKNKQMDIKLYCAACSSHCLPASLTMP